MIRLFPIRMKTELRRDHLFNLPQLIGKHTRLIVGLYERRIVTIR